MDLQQYLSKENNDCVTNCFGAIIFHKLAEIAASLLANEAATRQLNYGVALSDVTANLPYVENVINQISFAAQIVNLVSTKENLNVFQST